MSSVAAPPAAAGPQVRCTVEDRRLAELSGLAVVDGAVWAVTDGGRRLEVHRIDVAAGDPAAACAITDTRTAGIDPYDAEDLARGPDGALWVADIGDNERARDTVAVVVLPRRGEARLHRLTYPDGPHDAEALLVDGEGRPVVVTKEAGRPAGVYRTETAPDGVGPTPMALVGELTLPPSDTVGGPLGGLGSRVVTGAAATADGTVVALRSYTDAWLYPAPDGDPVAALTGAPTRVALPAEPQGEAIAFAEDGTLLSGSERRRGEPGLIRAVPAAAASAGTGAVPPAAVTPPVAPGGAAATDQAPRPEWLPAAIGGGVGVGVLLLMTLGIAVRAARRRS